MTAAEFFWFMANTVLSTALSLILVHKLVSWFDSFNLLERGGMGLMAGSVLLTIPTIWSEAPTPFDLWTTAALRLGAVIYFAGRLQRLSKHYRRNERAKESAAAHLAGKRGNRP